MGLDPASCLKAAKTIFACYRRDEAHDPDIYIAAVSAVLADYPESVVTLATDPRTGIAGTQKFLPAVAEIKEFCDGAQERQDRIARYASLPKFERLPPLPPEKRPNLFVPDNAPRFAKMLEKHNASGKSESYYVNRHTCADGIARAGVMIPLRWWEEQQKQDQDVLTKASRLAFERECEREGIDPSKGASPSLRRLIEEQNA